MGNKPAYLAGYELWKICEGAGPRYLRNLVDVLPVTLLSVGG